MKKIVKIFSIILICSIFIICTVISSKAIEQDETIQKFEFEESIEEFNNPDIGFYRPSYIKCLTEGEWGNTSIQYPNGLVHLRISLRAFSKKSNGDKDYDINEEHIESLNKWINQVREKGGTAIVRFAYDDFAGYKDLEPNIEVIEKHIEQLKPFFEENEDIIALVETGFLGPYGEQHSSEIVTKENIKRVTEKLLEVVPESRTVSVRKPGWYCATTGVNISEIDENITEEGTDAYRIGIFNDGYLGSASDLGTFVNREKEINWLNKQATHTIYGGEAVSAGINDRDENGNLYNSPEHIQEEMFKTHTSYLNIEWNDRLIASWKNSNYTGNDNLYENSSAFTYIKNHLGYRIVINETTMPKKIEQSSNATINIKLTNVGAGNVVNKKDTYIVLKNDTSEYTIPTTIDVRKWYSRESKNIDIEIPINENINIGNYDVYIKIANAQEKELSNKRTIRFANNDIWNEEIGANKIGKIEVVEKAEEILKGDIDRDGKITVNDLAILKLHLIGTNEIQESNLEIADTDNDNKITINDLAIIKLIIVEM